MTASIRILLADDHAVVREGMRALLEDFDEISVVGEAQNGDQALELLARVAPDLLMTDVKMPGIAAADLVKQATALLPAMRILVFTSFAEGRLVRALLDAGADGYLLKDAHRDEIHRAVHIVMEGRPYLHPDAQTALDESAGIGPLGKLTVPESQRNFGLKDNLPSYGQKIGELRAKGAKLAVIFGIGWGLAGVCPAPAIVNLGFASGPAYVFAAAMIAGMALYSFTLGCNEV